MGMCDIGEPKRAEDIPKESGQCRQCGKYGQG